MMNQHQLEGRRIAILVTDGVERIELTEPRRALESESAATVLIAPKRGRVRTWETDQWGGSLDVDLALEDATADDYDALLLPGGPLNSDALRQEPAAVEFVRQFVSTGRPIAAICHAAWLLIEADGVRGRRVTSWPSLRTDLINAGASWEDREVVADRGLVTSRAPEDLLAFNARMIEEFSNSPVMAH